MNKENQIKLLEEKLVELRKRWVKASPSMKVILEGEAKSLHSAIRLLKNVIRKQQKKKTGEKLFN